jgi:hypothetical protein
MHLLGDVLVQELKFFDLFCPPVMHLFDLLGDLVAVTNALLHPRNGFHCLFHVHYCSKIENRLCALLGAILGHLRRQVVDRGAWLCL